MSPPGKVIQLTWSSFNIESSSGCIYDYVEVYDNSTTFGGLIGRYCGRNSPPAFTSSGNLITIIFKSDFSNNNGGFTATYSFADATKLCGGRYFTSSGIIESPGWPKNYMHNKNCEWIITVPSGQQIELIRKHFEMEQNYECHFDYLEIRNGGNAQSPLYGKFCGTSMPETLTSFGNQMYLKMVTDSSQSFKGFQFEWDGSATGCGGTLTTNRGIITSPNYPDPYDDNAVCVWKVSISSGSTIQFIFMDIAMERTAGCYFDYVEVSI